MDESDINHYSKQPGMVVPSKFSRALTRPASLAGSAMALKSFRKSAFARQVAVRVEDLGRCEPAAGSTIGRSVGGRSRLEGEQERARSGDIGSDCPIIVEASLVGSTHDDQF